jgi:hypothetical protein
VSYFSVVDFDSLCRRLIGEGETERHAVERDFARLRIFVLLYLIGGEAGEDVTIAVRATLFDRVIISI